MKIKFDSNIKLVGIGLVPWTRLGPEKWLPNYKIASLYGWDLPESTSPRVFDLVGSIGSEPKLDKLNTQCLIKNTKFQNLLNDNAPDHDVLTYKPVVVPSELQNRKFLMVSPEFTSLFENKARFRETMGKRVKFPDYEVYIRADLEKSDVCYEKIMKGRNKVVIQDEQLSGGKGTFIVDSLEKYSRSLDNLDNMSNDTKVVISDFIDGVDEYSIQGCVTKYGVFCGPLQRQIVADEHLANLNVADGDKFCGAQINVEDQGSETHLMAKDAATKIGEILQQSGYKGIYGVDFLKDSSGQLYTLEVNPRITGVTPLLTAMHKPDESIPFYLLHILELGGYDYAIENKTSEYNSNGSLLVMHSQENTTVSINKTPKSGTYAIRSGKLKLISGSVDMGKAKNDQFVLEEYMPTGMPVKPGGRLLVLKLPRLVINYKKGSLNQEIIQLVDAVYKNIDVTPLQDVI